MSATVRDSLPRFLDDLQAQINESCAEYMRGKITRTDMQTIMQRARQRIVMHHSRMSGAAARRRDRLLRHLDQLSKGFGLRPDWRMPRQHSESGWVEALISIAPAAEGFGIGAYLRQGRHTLAKFSQLVQVDTEAEALCLAQNRVLQFLWGTGARRVRLYVASTHYLVITPHWKRAFSATELLWVRPGQNLFADTLARRATKPPALPESPAPEASPPKRSKPHFSLAGILTRPDGSSPEVRLS